MKNQTHPSLWLLILAIGIMSGCAKNEMRLKLDVYRLPYNHPIHHKDEAAKGAPVNGEKEAVKSTVQIIEQIELLDSLQKNLRQKIAEQTGEWESRTFLDFDSEKPEPETPQYAKMVNEDLESAMQSYKTALLKFATSPVEENYIPLILSRDVFTNVFSEFTNMYTISASNTINIPIDIPVVLPYNYRRSKSVTNEVIYSGGYNFTNMVGSQPENFLVDQFVATNSPFALEILTTNKLSIPHVLTNRIEITASITNEVPVAISNTTLVPFRDIKISVTNKSYALTDEIFTQKLFTYVSYTNFSEIQTIVTNVITGEPATHNNMVGYYFKTNIVISKDILTNTYVPIQQVGNAALTKWTLLPDSIRTTVETNVVATISPEIYPTITNLLGKFILIADDEGKQAKIAFGGSRVVDLDRLQDAADPMWRIVTQKRFDEYWNSALATNFFEAQGNSGVVVVRDSPIHYRIQRGNNNPTALVQSQLRISRALTDAAIEIAGTATGVPIKLPNSGGSTAGQSTQAQGVEPMAIARKRKEVEERLRITTNSISRIEVELTRLSALTNTVEIQAGLNNILNGAAKRFEK